MSPAAVLLNDPLGTKDDTYTIPATTGVDYLVAGKIVAAGTYPGAGTVAVTAAAQADYLITPAAAASWTFTFKGDLVGATPRITGTAKVGTPAPLPRALGVRLPSRSATSGTGPESPSPAPPRPPIVGLPPRTSPEPPTPSGSRAPRPATPGQAPLPLPQRQLSSAVRCSRPLPESPAQPRSGTR